jgi:hypothetical protein
MTAKPEDKPIKRSDIEFHSDAWARFERAVGTVAKAPPQHRASKKKLAQLKTRKQKKPSSRLGFLGVLGSCPSWIR